MSNWTLVQSKTNVAVAATTVTATFDAPTVAGNLVIVGIRTAAGIVINTPTDDASGGTNTYQNLGQNGTAPAPRVKAYVNDTILGIISKAASAITVTTGASTTIEIIIAEFAPGHPLQNISTAIGAGTTETSWATGSFTPPAGALIIAFASADVAASFTAGSGYTLTGAVGTFCAMEYKLSAPGSSETAPISVAVGGSGWAERAHWFDQVIPPGLGGTGSQPERQGFSAAMLRY